MSRYAVRGDFFDCEKDRSLKVRRDAFCVVSNGVIEGMYDELPGKDRSLKVLDFRGMIIMPGFIDLHTHAPQYTYRGLGMDLELLDWLERYAFPEESRYRDGAYAARAYRIFANDLRRSYTTRACIFGTIYTDSTILLMDMLEKTGLVTCVGKVNMDRNAPDYYIEETTQSVEETRRFIDLCRGRYKNTYPILTPRFIPSCTDRLMEQLGELQLETGLPAQSHLSENRGEIRWVKELEPESAFYGDAYDRYHLFGGACRTVMAHCVSSSDEELQRIREKGVYVAHCPNSNMNIRSGIAPVRKMLDSGIRVGIGTDVAGGYSLSMPEEMIHTVQMSNLYWRYLDESARPLNMADAFYMATRGGGEFFGKVGAFEPGYEFDAVVIDDAPSKTTLMTNDTERLQRSLYLHNECVLKEKFVRGRRIRLT